MKKYVCTRCGSDDVEIRVWWNPNTHEVGSSCDDNDAWCDACQNHCRLEETDILDLSNKFIVVTWPNVQKLMVEGFAKNAVLIDDEKGLEDFGPSACFVNAEWARSVLPELFNSKSILESLYLYVDWPDSQSYGDLDGFQKNAYPDCDGDGWFVSCIWLENLKTSKL